MNFVLKKRNLFYCNIAKTGTTTWMTILLDLSGKSKDEIDKKLTATDWLHTLGKKVAPKMNKNEWEKWSYNKDSIIRLMVVRHPFDRLGQFIYRYDRNLSPPHLSKMTYSL